MQGLGALPQGLCALPCPQPARRGKGYFFKLTGGLEAWPLAATLAVELSLPPPRRAANRTEQLPWLTVRDGRARGERTAGVRPWRYGDGVRAEI